MKWLLATLILLTGLLAGLYAALPWLAETLAVRAAATLDVEVRELSVSFPRWGEIAVDRLVASSQAYDLRAEQMIVRYHWQGIRERRLASVRAARLSVAVAGPAEEVKPLALGEQVVTLPGVVLEAWRKLPVDDVLLDDLQVRSGPLTFAGTLGLTPAAASLAGEVSGEESLGVLGLSLRADAEGLIDLAIRPIARPANVLTLVADARQLTGTVSIAWNLEVPVEDGELAVTLEGEGPVELDESAWRVGSGFRARVDGGDWRGQFAVAEAAGPWPDDQEGETVRIAGAWQTDTDVPYAASARGTLSARVDGSGAQLSVDPGMVATIDVLSDGTFSLEGMRLDSYDRLDLEVVLEPMTVTLGDPVRFALVADTARLQDFVVSPYIDFRLDSLAASPAGFAGAIAATVPALQLSGSGRVRGDAKATTFAVELSARQMLTAPLLATLLPGWDRPYDVDAGSVGVTGALSLGDGGLVGDLVLALEDLRSHYGDVVAAGIGGEARVKLSDGGWRVEADQVTVRFADVGFPARNVGFSLALTPSAALLSDVRGKTLGGEFVIDRLAYDIERGTAAFLVTATGIDLAEVLALEGESVTGNGILDGQLPIEIIAGGARIDGGRFVARAPGGVLRYPDAGKAADALGTQGVGFALAPLVDFRYEVLDAHVDLEPNGDLLLGVRLEGRSPDFERPYHYNLNISESVPALLKSLRVSETFQKRLEKVLQR